MTRPRICAVVVNSEPQTIKEAREVADFFEVRIDLIGESWRSLVRTLKKPWIACNRTANEGGRWQGNESDRINQLLEAIELGASIVDLELNTENVKRLVRLVKKKAKCLLSFHDLERTPPLEAMKEIVQKELDAGADICKLVTTARELKDNLATLELISSFPRRKIISFAMGPLGLTSRVLCPMAGGYLTYASITEGSESAPGQITVSSLRNLYKVMGYGNQ